VIEVADREEVHAVERAREERCHEDETERRAEGIGDDAAKSVARKRR
jgi:hypothetical protein